MFFHRCSRPGPLESLLLASNQTRNLLCQCSLNEASFPGIFPTCPLFIMPDQPLAASVQPGLSCVCILSCPARTVSEQGVIGWFLHLLEAQHGTFVSPLCPRAVEVALKSPLAHNNSLSLKMYKRPNMLMRECAQVYREKEADDRSPLGERGGGQKKKPSLKTRIVPDRKQSNTKEIARDLC